TLRMARDGHFPFAGGGVAAMAQGSMVVKDGIRVIQGTPTVPLTRATLFLKIWRVLAEPGAPQRTMASLHVARPGRDGYVIKELVLSLEIEPNAAIAKAVAIARAGDVAEVYVNADLNRLPTLRAAS